MLTTSHFTRIFRVSAWYDIAVTWPYATPFTLPLMHDVLNAVHGAAGWAPIPEFSPFATLFANFFGTVVLIWSVVRLHLNDPRLARYDALGRFLFSSWMIYALSMGVSPIVWVFLVIEISFGILQALPVRSTNSGASAAEETA
ncbi:hypothetical protein CFI11_16650 [Thalassococcus sp. S3]|nr:hypothetical protein CFI11_16650 [Thalassococcus sp. S3]